MKSFLPTYAVFLFFVFFLASARLHAEGGGDAKPDIKILKDKNPSELDHIHQHDIRFMRSSSGNFLVRNNPVSLFFGGMMFVYQQYVSPQLPSECLYSESCSHFSQSLILRYGLLKGVIATSDRLMRCNRISALDVHPLFIDEKSGRVQESVEIYKLSQ